MMLPGGVAHAQEALNKANANCSARFNEALSDQTGQAQYRVVYVGTMTGPNKQLSGEVHHTKDDWMNAWADTVVGKVYSNHGAHPHHCRRLSGSTQHFCQLDCRSAFQRFRRYRSHRLESA